MSDVTMTQVAKAAGVSVSTVSHVLNGTRPVAPATRTLVQDAIDALGFTHKPVSRSLGAGSTVPIGVALSLVSTLYSQELIAGIEEEAQRQESRSRKLLTYLWEQGWSPFQVVRSTVFWGPMLIGKYSSRRFIGLTEEDTRAMHDYIMNITLAKGSGEYCICESLLSLYRRDRC